MPQYDFTLAVAHLTRHADPTVWGLFTDDILRVVLHLRAGDGSNIDAFARAFGQARFEKVKTREGVKLVYRVREPAFIPERLRGARVAWTFSENYTPANGELTNYSTVGYVGALHALHFLHTCGKLRKEYHVRAQREPLFLSDADYETCVRDLRRYCVHNRVFQWEFAREDEMHGYELPRIWWHAPTNGARVVQPFVMPAAPERSVGYEPHSIGDEPEDMRVRVLALGRGVQVESEKKKKRAREPAQNENSASSGGEQKKKRADDVSSLFELAQASDEAEPAPPSPLPPLPVVSAAEAAASATAVEINDLRRARGSPEPAAPRSYADLLDEYVRKWNAADTVVSNLHMNADEYCAAAVRVVLAEFTKYARAARVELARAFDHPDVRVVPTIPLDFTFTVNAFRREGTQLCEYYARYVRRARVKNAMVGAMNAVERALADDEYARDRTAVLAALEPFVRANHVPFIPPHATH